MKIYCCGCEMNVEARLTDGMEIYPHREDLKVLPFWKCDECGNYVGCHHKTNNPTHPLGCIPTDEIRRARQHIHRVLDPIWKQGKMKRGILYGKIAERMGRKKFHTSHIRSIEEARQVYKIVRQLAEEMRVMNRKTERGEL